MVVLQFFIAVTFFLWITLDNERSTRLYRRHGGTAHPTVGPTVRPDSKFKIGGPPMQKVDKPANQLSSQKASTKEITINLHIGENFNMEKFKAEIEHLLRQNLTRESA
jgi:hypothetical protein